MEWLKKTELFETLTEPQLRGLLSRSSVKAYNEGDKIFLQGEKASRLYFLIRGTIDLTVRAEGKVDLMTSKIEKEGSVFGTAALMEPYQYNVTATCLKSSEVLILEAGPLRKAMQEDPAMGMEIMKKLATIYFNRLNELRSGVSNLFKVFKIRTP